MSLFKILSDMFKHEILIGFSLFGFCYCGVRNFMSFVYHIFFVHACAL
jgi:hypothetical protein